MPDLSDSAIPLHLDVEFHNTAGLVMSNPDYHVVAVRWLSLGDAPSCRELLDAAMNEASRIAADACIQDFRKCLMTGHADMLHDALVQVDFIASKWAFIFAEDVAQQSVLSRLPQETSFKGIVCGSFTNFNEAAVWLDSIQSNTAIPQLLGSKPKDFWASYGGSVYSIPELGVTVMRTSGNVRELDLVGQCFKMGHHVHTQNGAAIAVINTTASPPLLDQTRYQYTYKEIIFPLSASGAYKQVIHVREDKSGAIVRSSEHVAAIFFAVGVPWFDVHSMEQALRLVRVLRGLEPGKVEVHENHYTLTTSEDDGDAEIA